MKPLLQNYLNVHKYLQDLYSYRKSRNKTFSYETWAREVGVADRSYLRALVMGKRPFNKMTMDLMKNALFESELEKSHFVVLVCFTQAKTREEQELLRRELLQYLTPPLKQREINAHFEFLSNPLVPRLKTFLSYEDSSFAQEELAKILNASPEAIEEALKVLKNLSLQQAHVSNEKTENTFKINDLFMDEGLRVFYENAFADAQKAIDLPVEDRRFKAYYLALNGDEFNDFLSDFQTFMRIQMQKRNYESVSDRKLFQVCFSTFAVSKKTPHRKCQQQETEVNGPV